MAESHVGCKLLLDGLCWEPLHDGGQVGRSPWRQKRRTLHQIFAILEVASLGDHSYQDSLPIRAGAFNMERQTSTQSRQERKLGGAALWRRCSWQNSPEFYARENQP
ncbi:hypothetical protein ACOMHN_021028 [Nucella lapillus]